ncbi:MAG: HpcH/HpaI aldolase family protein [Chloroflexota bacterium]
MAIVNTCKERLKAGKTCVGVSLTFPSPAVVELCAYAGFHFVRIDCEHGPMDPVTAEHMIRAAEAAGITPLVRPPANLPHETLRLLDAGAMGVLAPGIETKEDAERAARSVRYYPEGQRGLAGGRWAHFGSAGPLPELVKQENDAMLLMALIESGQGVENLDEIIAVSGVDVIAIGPNDLSQSLGFPAQTSNPVVQQHINTIIDKALAAGKWVHYLARDTEAVRQRIDRGVQMIELTGSNLFLDAGRGILKGLPL